MSVRRLSKTFISGAGAAAEKSSNFIAGYSPAIDEMDLIERVTVGSGGTSSITFSNIPQTYQHLQIRGVASSVQTGNRATDVLRFRIGNGSVDTGANYSQHNLGGNGSNPFVWGDPSISTMTVEGLPGSSTSARKSCFVIDILDYASTSKYKTLRHFSGEETNESFGSVRIISGLWMSTSQVNAIQFYGASYNLAQHSTASLYGVKA